MEFRDGSDNFKKKIQEAHAYNYYPKVWTQMCEWLLHGEWCDVKLLCGGRAFNAHRAVLASVSAFLRELLLSCPMDDSPTFIVLPDFNLDAMSSVLYYIYNGEVVVQKENIEMFLDIINAMQIFIDIQCFPNITENISVKLKVDSKMYRSKKDIFALGFSENYVYLKKDNEIQTALPHYLNISDKNDMVVRNQNQSSETISSLGNLKPLCRDRQRNSFLRDLFIETYPRNGNVNGLEAGVLAIPNECYQTSVLLTNANVVHLNNKILSATCKKASEHNITYLPSALYPRSNQRHAENKCKLSCSEAKSSKDKFKNDFNHTQIKQDSMNPWMDYSSVTASSLFPLGLQESIVARKIPTLEYNASSTIQSYVNQKESTNFAKNIYASSSSKVTILNHVLDSPWTPRVPGVYKPFRKKPDHVVQFQESSQKLSFRFSSNDNNNNIETLRKSIDVAPPTELEDEIIPKTHSPANKTELNCNICNQVFTTDVSYTAHMRRHSTNARYTCGECGKTFSQLRNFKYHMSIHRGTREFAATCSVCGKYFNDKGYLSSHMKIHRNRKEYKCTLCPKSFNQRVAYNMHMRIHTGVKPHVCSECGKAFSRKMLLKQHQRTHSGERPYACPHCDKRFADRSNMTLHLRLHTGVKPFSCTLCPKSFTKKHHLKSHLNFHTGSKPYSCPRCKLAFTQSSNMRTHMKKCHAPEPIADSATPPIS